MSRNEADADAPPPFDCRLGSGRADERACGLLPSVLDSESRVNGRIDCDDEPVGEVMPRGGGENGGDDGGDDHADGDVANRDAALPLRCPARRESALCGLPPPPQLPRRCDRDWCGSGEMTGRDAFGDRELNLGDRTPNDDGKGSDGDDDDDEDGRRSGELVRSRRFCRSSATR